MRIIIAPHMAIVLSTTLLFLVIATKESSANQLVSADVSIAFKAISQVIEDYLGEMGAISDAEQVEVRVWMHTGKPKDVGCGLWFGVTGHSGKNVSDCFPPEYEMLCRSDSKKNLKYLMRLTFRNDVFSKKLQVGNDQVKEIQIHADGWRDTLVKTMCFGLSERTIAGGPRAFCIDNDILKSCKALTGKWSAIKLDSNDIKLTRTNRGLHKIMFKDVEKLIGAFETINRNPDDADAAQKVCDQIELKGGEENDEQTCPARGPLIDVPDLMPGAILPIALPPGDVYAHKKRVNPDSCFLFG